MNKLVINNFEEFEQYVGKELGVSDYMQITQEQINKFADATFDHQWIHVDVEKAKAESPYKSTIFPLLFSGMMILPYFCVRSHVSSDGILT